MPQRGILWEAKTIPGSLRAVGTFCAKTAHWHEAYLRHATLHSGLFSTHPADAGFLRNIASFAFPFNEKPRLNRDGALFFFQLLLFIFCKILLA